MQSNLASTAGGGAIDFGNVHRASARATATVSVQTRSGSLTSNAGRLDWALLQLT
jgi:hypothetical protein